MNLCFRFIELLSNKEDFIISVLLIAISVVFAFFSPKFIKLILFFWGLSFPLYGLHSFSINNQIFELLLTIISLLLTFTNIKDPFNENKNSRIIFLLSLYIILSCLSLLLLPSENVFRTFFLIDIRAFASLVLNARPDSYYYSFAAANRLILYSIFIVQLSHLVEAKEVYHKLFIGIIIGCVLSVVVGLLDYYNLVSLSWLRPDLYGTRRPRLQSTFGNPGWFAEYVIITLPFVISKFFQKKSGYFCKLILLFTLLIFAITLILVKSRAAWIAYPTILFFLWRTYHSIDNTNQFSWFIRKKNIVIVLVVVPIIMFISILSVYQFFDSMKIENEGLKFNSLLIDEKQILKSRAAKMLEPSKESRIKIWRQTLKLGNESPFFGMGYESYRWHVSVLQNAPIPILTISRPVVNKFADLNQGLFLHDTPHSFYLQLFVNGGVAGVLLWVFLNGYVIALLLYDLKKKDRKFNIPIIFSIVSFHLYGVFQSLQYIPVIWLLVFINLGYAMTINENILPRRLMQLSNYACIALIGLVVIAGIAYSQNIGSKKLAEKYGLKVYAANRDGNSYLGFYSPEKWYDGIYRWTADKGIIRFADKGIVSYSIKVLHYDIKDNPVIVSICLDGKPTDQLTFWEPMSIGRQYFLPENDQNDHELLFSVNRTWNPKKHGINQDNREIGIAVSEIKKLKIYPKNGFGFYSTEISKEAEVPGWPKDQPLEYRWTQQRASLNLQNEFKNGGSIFLLGAHPELPKNPLRVELIGDSGVIKKIILSRKEWQKIDLGPDDFGNSKMLTFQVDKTWNPKLSGISDDGRDLGVAVALLEAK
jgi:O-antigen ligase